MISPRYKKLSDESTYDNNKVVFAKFDGDEVPDLMEKLQSRALPTFFAIRSGHVETTVEGAILPKLEEMVENSLAEVKKKIKSEMGITKIRDLAHCKELLANNQVVIIYAEGGPSLRYIDIRDTLFKKVSEAEQFNKIGVEFAKLDIQAAKDFSEEFKIGELPAFRAFHHGDLKGQVVGGEAYQPDEIMNLVREFTSKVK
ncbi:uncharacterized protein B0J16DRAFT_389821 [Fusarium flagelliforme]|nr:uncharacterized protein B0J16DRAFT_389821 [Fusarium flagelliforme]KAH7173940.1 hypothetical protein B0J16DRAFT_389821 [Fusarium flagelliforme]